MHNLIIYLHFFILECSSPKTVWIFIVLMKKSKHSNLSYASTIVYLSSLSSADSCPHILNIRHSWTTYSSLNIICSFLPLLSFRSKIFFYHPENTYRYFITCFKHHFLGRVSYLCANLAGYTLIYLAPIQLSDYLNIFSKSS